MKPSLYFLTIWAVLALIILVPVTRLLQASFPIFTVIWILVSLVASWKMKDPGRVGFRKLSWNLFLQTTAINLGGVLGLMLLFEPWSHTYQKLLALVFASSEPDTTFAWLLRYPRLPALGMMAVYSGLVTLYGEELFFRGWLLQLLQKRLGTVWAVILQAVLFVLPNLLVAFALPTLQGLLYALVYTWLAIGLIGGWAAAHTKSIWPSLVTATLCNLVLVSLIWPIR